MERSDANQVQEPLETYFQTPHFLKTFKRITFSTPEEQEEAHRQFCRSLTPLQRLEYLHYLNQIWLGNRFIPDRFEAKIHFD